MEYSKKGADTGGSGTDIGFSDRMFRRYVDRYEDSGFSV